MPADLGGAHYYEYDIGDLDASRLSLQRQIAAWTSDNSVEGVRSIRM